ncbi:hypothetical protein [Acinetobacter haemolyticus]|uniref:hypothetical protein n=1 Tax=Acinetobacter haemolyticus TaxID=29430 RepID=UPI0021CD2F7E|nr:hypothetical protein [Acinetobacter haemolyticus]MCU4378239.1 hypothetical protein [Acinetobacter haemolyticus]
MLIIAFFLVYLIGLSVCFKEAKQAWNARKINSMTAFEKRAHVIKSCTAIFIALAGIGGLMQAIISSGVLQ